MAHHACTNCGFDIDYVPGEAGGKLTCQQCGRAQYVLNAGAGTFSVRGAEAELVWRASPRRLLAWAAKMVEGDETDCSLALLCCHIAVEIAKGRALRSKRSGGPKRPKAKERILEKLRGEFTKIGLAYDKMSFADKLWRVEQLRHGIVHEGRIVTKPETYEALKAADAAVAELEK